jgi:uncharacterized lipoprotein YddW (UPF0748 family)
MSDRKNILRIVFVLILSLAGAMLSALEIRSIWVTPWDINTAEKIDRLIEDCVENNINEILAEIRYRGDALYYPNKTDKRFKNDEPRSYILEDNPGFDPLDYLINKARQHSIRIQGWGTVLVITPAITDRLAAKHIYFKNRQWITAYSDGTEMATTDLEGAYLDPGVPEVREYLSEVFADIAANYDLDGIQLDYIRYPDQRFGYNSISLKRYESEKLQDPNLNWELWKERQITETVRLISEKIKAVKPEMIISAAVKPEPKSARKYFGQNWTDWLDKNYVDTVYLMAYHTQDEQFNKFLKNLPSEYSGKIIVGIRSWADNTSYSPYQVKSKLGSVLSSSFKGVAFFSYSGIVKNSYFSVINPLLKDLSINQPVREMPSYHFISGRVSGLNNQALTGAKIIHLGSQRVSYTDSKGEFMIDNVKADQNRIRIEYYGQSQEFEALISQNSGFSALNEFNLNNVSENPLNVIFRAYSDSRKVYLAWHPYQKRAFSLYRKRIYSPVSAGDPDYQFLGLMPEDRTCFIDSGLEPFCLYEYKLIDDQMSVGGLARVELDFTWHPLDLQIENRMKNSGMDNTLSRSIDLNFSQEFDLKFNADDSLKINWSILDYNEKPLICGKDIIKNNRISWNGLTAEGANPESPIFIFEYQIEGQKKWFRKYFY